MCNQAKSDLRLRKSREFGSVAEYERFLRKIMDKRNRGRRERLAEEMAVMADLPERGWNEAVEERVAVNDFSMVTVAKALYSVPSRLIRHTLRALIYAEVVRLFLGDTLVVEMPRQQAGGKRINYRHVISHLMRKPGAFAGYVHRDDLFPSLTFRRAYDELLEKKPERAEKEYLAILHYAAMGSEQDVEAALEILLGAGDTPNLVLVKELTHVEKGALPDIQIPVPDLFTPSAQRGAIVKDGQQLANMLKSFYLPTFARNYDDFAKRCAKEKLGHAEYLLQLSFAERDQRLARRTERLLKKAKLPQGKTLDEFEFSKQPGLSLSRMKELAEGGCCTRRQPPGSKSFDKYEALIIDDISYIPQTRDETDVLFVLLAERYETRSLVITSNLVISQWDQIFKDVMTTKAAIDRLVNHSTILELVGPSGRCNEALSRKNQKKPTKTG